MTRPTRAIQPAELLDLDLLDQDYAIEVSPLDNATAMKTPVPRMAKTPRE